MSTINPTLLEIRPSDFGQEGVNANPEQGEDRGQENGPHNDDGGHAVLSAHQAFQEGIQVHNHPECKEELAKQRTPRLIPVVDGVRDSGHHAYEVDDEQRCRGDQQGRPLEQVELAKIIVIRRFRGDGEVGVNACKHLQEPLENRKQVS